MNFRKFLNEKYRDEITLKKAVKIFKEKCKNVDLENGVLYRGVYSNYGSDFNILTGEDGERKSANTTNHYTKIIDHNLKGTDYPLRSKSTICSTDDDYARVFSAADPLVLIPFDGVKIGVCASDDMWESKVKFDGITMDVAELNELYGINGVKDDSFKTIVDGIEKAVKAGKRQITRLFTDDKSIKEQLEDVYSIENLGFSLIENKDISKLKGSRECWVGGSCLAIEWNKFKEFKELVKKS